MLFNWSRQATITKTIYFTLFLLLLPTPGESRQQGNTVDPALFQAMKWRNIGPFRGGRVTAVAGAAIGESAFYMGAAGGGVWKTSDNGLTWKNVSDGFFKTSSVGALAVSPSDPNVIYAGMGEAEVRGVTTTHGDGVYKSTDAGKTWEHLGLAKTRHISTIRVHPQNPDLVYVAAQGNFWGKNAERGIYRSADGGKSWKLVLHVDQRSGASDLAMDMKNPRILYAAFWHHQRLPWKVISGGPGSGIHKSTDGGDTWQELKKGLPKVMGKIGVSVSASNPDRLWAIIEADEGGLFRSENAGKSWKRVNKERILRARSWYYTKVVADPLDEETVWVINAPLMKSIDGGKTFKQVPTPHGDNHDMWIHPDNNLVMINGNDGGGNVSLNGGKTWSVQSVQPTAQFYRVITDNRFPYYVYGGQQDNSTVAIASRTTGNGIGIDDWYAVGGCESAHIAFDPDSPEHVYAGCYQGIITEFTRSTEKLKNVMAHPFLGLGSDPKDQKYRFNWNAPILTSPHDRSVIYHAGNVILKSDNRGLSWTPISPDLTHNQKEKQGPGGGPITNEAAGAETYNTLMSVVESVHEAGTIWAGSDDGLVHLTRDGGTNWQNVTPRGVMEAMINTIEVSPHDSATAYIAVAGYKLNDFTPHIYKTADYGKSWVKLVSGIPDDTFVRAVREDPKRQGLLYAGTEAGMFASFNDGEDWQPLQLNLPVTPITDLTIRNNDLVVATQGRAFWILDDLTPLHQITPNLPEKKMHLFAPRKAVRMDGSVSKRPGLGTNPDNGVVLHYYFAEAPDTTKDALKLEILDAEGKVIRLFSSRPKKKAAAPRRGGSSTKPLPAKKGMNRFVWDMRIEGLPEFKKHITFGNLQGYKIAPGTYQARLRHGSSTLTEQIEVIADPRVKITKEAFNEQQNLLAQIHETVRDLHQNVKDLRIMRGQIKAVLGRQATDGKNSGLEKTGQDLIKKMEEWEEPLVQKRQETFQDVINFHNRLNAHFIFLLNAIDSADPPLTDGAKTRFQELADRWAEHKSELGTILSVDVPAFNALVTQQAIPAVKVNTTK